MAGPRMPVVLPVVDVTIDDHDGLTVTVDQEPYDVADNVMHSGRVAVGRVLADITAQLASPIRVHVHEADGTVFTDLVTPRREDPTEAADAPQTTPRPLINAHGLGLAMEGFTPGEPVAVALLVSEATADAIGTAYVRLPPALLARHSPAVVLLGRESGLVAFTSDETAVASASGAA